MKPQHQSPNGKSKAAISLAAAAAAGFDPAAVTETPPPPPSTPMSGTKPQTTLPPGTILTVVPADLEEFTRHAKDLTGDELAVTLANATDGKGQPALTARGKRFSTGSVGWSLEGSVHTPWAGQRVRLSVRGNLIVIKSGGEDNATPDDANPAQFAAALLDLKGKARGWGERGKFGWLVSGKTTLCGCNVQVNLFLAAN